MNSSAKRLNDSPRRGLGAFFDQAGDAAQANRRLQQPFRALACEDDAIAPIVLAGAGAWGRHTARRLHAAGRPAVAFVDNAQRNWGTTVCALPVMSPGEAVDRFGDVALFVTTIYNGAAVRRQLTSLGCRRVLHASAFYHGLPAIFLPYYQLDSPDAMFASRATIESVHDAWHDETSRRIFESRLSSVAGLPTDAQEPVGPPSACYFDPSLYAIDEDDCIIDCGAFDGDTIRHVLRTTGRPPRTIVALEPDPDNADALRAFVGRLAPSVREQIEVIEAAASRSAGEIVFDASGTVAAQTGTGTGRVRTITLDSLSGRYRPTCVKMDVEGHEFDALIGATALMRDAQPILAISLYHRADDLWRIPDLIGRTNPSYRLVLRCYAEDGWESVCYAIPASRLLLDGLAAP